MPESLRILVIDDDPVMRELLEAVLGFEGHSVATTDSGDSALEHLKSREEGLDVVLTDLHMPGLQGEQLAARLLEARSPGTVIVGMSGSYPTQAETSLLDSFLQKPFTFDHFTQALTKARHRVSTTASTAADIITNHVTGRDVLDDTVFAHLKESIAAPQLHELYAMTLDDVLTRVEKIEASRRDGDLTNARREAHAIKGACGMVGATELYHLASTTETASEADTMPVSAFRPACERLKRMLDERLQD